MAPFERVSLAHEVDALIAQDENDGILTNSILFLQHNHLAFTLPGLQFAMLLGLMVRLSVILPFIGAALASLPVAVVAFLQWGWGGDFVWVMAVYGVIQLLDGNVLSPVLFSEAVGLHPVAIIVAVLVCGGLWGFWGLFFAVPLATLVEVLIAAWPRRAFLKAPSF